MPRGVWLSKSGWPVGHIEEQKGKFRVHIRSKVHKQHKTFQTRKAAEEFRWATSDRVGLTRNRIRRKIGERGVLEMQLHHKGKAWDGLISTFDEEDLDLVARHTWCQSYGYTVSTITNIKMHNLLSPPPAGKIVDHINRDPSDDRKSNHRFVTHLENGRNKSATKTNTSGHHGIVEQHTAKFYYWDPETQKEKTSSISYTAHRLNGRDLTKEAEAKRDAMDAKTKKRNVPSITRCVYWRVQISQKSPDGGGKTFNFQLGDPLDRERALEEAIVYRDYLQTRTNSSNGKLAQVT